MEDFSTFRLRFGVPRDGWAFLRLEVGERAIEVSFSRVPDDTMLQLAAAADAIVTGPTHRHVVMRGEPTELELLLSRKQGTLATVALARFRDHRRADSGTPLLALMLPAIDVGRAVWRAMRNLENLCPADDYERHWRGPFPTQAVALLGARLGSGYDREAGEQADEPDNAQSDER